MSKSNDLKLVKWKNALRQANLIKDKIGMPVDEGIKELLIGLWLQQIPTESSCEGHSDDDAFPYVHIGFTPQLDEVNNIKELIPVHELLKKFPYLDKAKKRNLKIQLKLINLLSEYYKEHYVTEDERLTLTKIGFYGDVRLESQGTLIRSILTKKEKVEKINIYQAEMQSFGIFLKEKYFSKP